MNYSFLSKTAMFHGIPAEEIAPMLQCLEGKRKQFSKGETIYHAGDFVQSMGLVLSGSVHIENDDLWGNKTLLDSIGPGFVFAETYACVQNEPLMISVVAAEDTEVLFLDVGRLLRVCPSACTHHSKIIRNLLAISAQKNLNLSRRIFHTTSKTIRGRLLSYLSFQATQHGAYEFTIPFNRQQLADYLGVDRSALSNELSKMQKEELLEVQRSHFRLLEPDLYEGS